MLTISGFLWLIADLGLSRADVGLLVGISFVPVFAVGTLVAGPG